MIKGDRDIGGSGEELEKPCHWIFDLTVNHNSAYNLEVGSPDLVPHGATNIRPIFEGTVVQETYDLSDPKHPKPVRKVHTHEFGDGYVSRCGYRWTTTRDEPMRRLEGTIFRLRHPIISD